MNIGELPRVKEYFSTLDSVKGTAYVKAVITVCNLGQLVDADSLIGQMVLMDVTNAIVDNSASIQKEEFIRDVLRASKIVHEVLKDG